jgi:hypothetical protein
MLRLSRGRSGCDSFTKPRFDAVVLRRRAMSHESDPREVILEFLQIGALIRVSAMEPHSLTEVVIYGPASAGEAALRRTVLCKLDYVLARCGSEPALTGKSVATG